MSEPDHAPGAEPAAQCSFCGYPIVRGAVTSGGLPGEQFCSETCRDAAADDETPFVGRLDYKYVRPGVPVLDRLLPQGIRSDSFVLIRGEEGGGRRELQLELVWRALQRGEPAVVVSFLDPPTAVAERFLSLGWNVLPALEAGDLRVIDCFTQRLSDPERLSEGYNDWNAHLASALDDATTVVRDPSDVHELEGRLNSLVEDLEMSERGFVAIDSLEEMGILVSDQQVENFLKEIQAEICRNRYVPLFAGLCADRSVTSDQQQMRATGGGLSTDITYFSDGIVDIKLNSQVVKDTRLKQVAIRNMNGVRYVPQWLTFELGPNGHVSFDPTRETATVYDPEQLAGERPRGLPGALDRPQEGDHAAPAAKGGAAVPFQEAGASPAVEGEGAPANPGQTPVSHAGTAEANPAAAVPDPAPASDPAVGGEPRPPAPDSERRREP